jgi:hypothetical protein
MAETTPEAIRRLIEETDALPRHELPDRPAPGKTAWSEANRTFWRRVKDPRQYDKDMRRAYFLEKLRNEHRDYAHDQRLYPGQYGVSTLEDLRDHTQPYTGDDSLSNASRWMASLPGAVYATGQMLANAVDPVATPYPSAPDDYAKNMNNLLIFGEPFGVNKNHMRDMADMRDREAARSWKILPTGPYNDAISEDRLLAGLIASPKSGERFLSEAGVSGPVAHIWGGVMDGTVDPLYSPAKTLKGVAVDYGLPVGAALMAAWQDFQRPAAKR